MSKFEAKFKCVKHVKHEGVSWGVIAWARTNATEVPRMVYTGTCHVDSRSAPKTMGFEVENSDRDVF